MSNKIGLALLVGFLALAPVMPAAAGEDSRSQDQIAIETAHTAADHAALAKQFRAKAAEARSDAAVHEAMARSYGLQKRGAMDQMGGHCKKIASNDMSNATEYDALAKLHDAESMKAK